MRLYIHIPFCDSKCGYCAFYSKVGDKEKYAPYMKSLLEDLIFHLDKFNVVSIDSVFLGGGTPNIIESSLYINIFEALHPLLSRHCEITSEANPNLLTKSWLQDLKSLGLNRLSLGVQSFFEDKLKLLERNHNFKHIQNSFEIAAHLIGNVNIDLIYDTKLDNEARIKKELQMAINLGVEHISAYSLSIEMDSKFENKTDKDLLKRKSDSQNLKDFLITNGFEWYEVSNFTKNKKCKHNLGYWRYDDYLGVGIASVGKIDTDRYSTLKDLDNYIANPTFRITENLSKNDINFEKMFLGFRSEVGVDEDILNKDKLEILLNENICVRKDKKIFAKNYLLADEITTWIL